MSALFAFRPMTVFDISCPPREAFERCMGFWATIGIRSETPGMGDQFAMRGWTGTEIAIGHRRGSGPDADLGDLGAIAPGLGIALLAVHLTEPMRKPIDWTRLIVAARPVPGSHPRSELWCFPWDDTIRGPRLTKAPLDRAFDKLAQTLTRQGSSWVPHASLKRRNFPGILPSPTPTSRRCTARHARRPAPALSISDAKDTHETVILQCRSQPLAHCVPVYGLSPGRVPRRGRGALRRPATQERHPDRNARHARAIRANRLGRHRAGYREHRKAFLVDAIASTTTTGIIAELFPRAVPDLVKRAFLEKTRIEVIARPIPGGMRPKCELWCHFDYTSTNETMFAEDYIASMLEGVEQSFRNEGLVMTAPERLRYRDMPHNVPLTLRTLGAMRKAAQKMTHSNPSR